MRSILNFYMPNIKIGDMYINNSLSQIDVINNIIDENILYKTIRFSSDANRDHMCEFPKKTYLSLIKMKKLIKIDKMEYAKFLYGN